MTDPHPFREAAVDKQDCIYPDCLIWGEWYGAACEHSCEHQDAMRREAAMREALAAMKQERRVLLAFNHHDLTRDWFAVELRPAFDRLVASGCIEPTLGYGLTYAGRARLLAMPHEEDEQCPTD